MSSVVMLQNCADNSHCFSNENEWATFDLRAKIHLPASTPTFYWSEGKLHLSSSASAHTFTPTI